MVFKLLNWLLRCFPKSELGRCVISTLAEAVNKPTKKIARNGNLTSEVKRSKKFYPVVMTH